MFRKAFVMETVAASHYDYRLWGGKHVVPADGTITLGGSFDASVSILYGYGQAHTTGL
jgi:hypothetical protein